MDHRSTNRTKDDSVPNPIRRAIASEEGLRWENVSIKKYKPQGTHFKRISRQLLFDSEEDLHAQLRYFEIAPGGHSTLERHEHSHAVLILAGNGRALVGNVVHEIAAFDLVRVPSSTWHQFRAGEDNILGFLCLVSCDRDRPILPTTDEVETLKSDPQIGAFIRV